MENRIETSRVKIVTTISDFASNNCADYPEGSSGGGGGRGDRDGEHM